MRIKFPKIFWGGQETIATPLWQNIVIIAVIAIFLGIASFYWLFPILGGIEQNIIDSQISGASQAAVLLDIFLDKTFTDLLHFGGHIFDDGTDEKRVAEILFESRPDFLGLFVFDLSGKLAFSVINDSVGGGAERFFSGTLARDTVFFQGAIRDGRYISSVFLGREGPTVQIAAPIRRAGNIIGVAVGEINFTLLWEEIAKTHISNGKVYLVDGQGTVIADPDMSRARSGENLKYREIVDLLVRGRSPIEFQEYLNERNEMVLASGLRMPGTGWGVIVEQVKSGALKQRNQILFTTILFASASAILIFLLFLSTLRLVHAWISIQKEQEEKARIIAYLPDGLIEYNGENRVLAINPTARQYLEISEPLPSDLYVLDNRDPVEGFEKLWNIFYPPIVGEGGQARSYEVKFDKPDKKTYKVITVYIEGGGAPSEQRYLKILHEVGSA